MSAIHFMDNPFPDNHNGFDYAPKSESDEIEEEKQRFEDSQNRKAQNQMVSMLASIFK
jgi:hypothetical protein